MNGNIECAFVGRVLDVPQIKTSSAGKPWTSLRASLGDGDNVQYVRVALFGELAEQIARTVEKGVKIYCEGTLKLDRWKTADGQERSGLSCAAWKCEAVGASAIGCNKPAKPKAEAGDKPASHFIV